MLGSIAFLAAVEVERYGWFDMPDVTWTEPRCVVTFDIQGGRAIDVDVSGCPVPMRKEAVRGMERFRFAQTDHKVGRHEVAIRFECPRKHVIGQDFSLSASGSQSRCVLPVGRFVDDKYGGASFIWPYPAPWPYPRPMASSEG